MVAGSPVYVIYGGMVMTEIPMLLASLSGLLVYQRGIDERRAALLLLGGAICGVAIGVREQASVLCAPYLVLAPLVVPRERRPRLAHLLLAWTTAAAVLAAAPLVWSLTDPSYLPTIRGWLRFMREEKLRHPLALVNLPIWVAWLVAIQPVALGPALRGAAGLWRRRRELPAAATLAGISIVVLLSLVFYQDLLYSPRYLLVGLPGLALLAGVALAPLVDRVGARRAIPVLALAAAHVVVLCVAAAIVSPYRSGFALARSYHERVARLPASSVLVVGQLCPYISYLKVQGYPSSWEVVCPGWTWPRERLGATIDGHLARGKPVFIDLDHRLWRGERLRQDLAHWTRISARYALVPAEGGLFRILPSRRL
jgi:hypothetical protein